MSKERLEEIHENKIMNIDGITDELQSIELTPEEYAYLIAHAGRVEELERVVDKQSQVILRQDSELDVMEQQNKRYSELISYMADTHFGDWDVAGLIARAKELKGGNGDGK